jgi:UDP-N-acetylglucosamine acyltransferase
MDTQVQITDARDPRRLRELMERAELLAREHGLRSVVVGLAGFEATRCSRRSSTTSRARCAWTTRCSGSRASAWCCCSPDVDVEQASGIVHRLLGEFRENFPSANEPSVGLGFFEVAPGVVDVSVKSVLPNLFATPPKSTSAGFAPSGALPCAPHAEIHPRDPRRRRRARRRRRDRPALRDPRPRADRRGHAAPRPRLPPGPARARRAQSRVAVRGARLRTAAPRLGSGPRGRGSRGGDENTFRESVTISRAASDDVPTRVGNRNYWMANSHAGHDCEIGNGCVIANGTLLGGSVRIGDGVVTGGNVAIHQFCHVGRGALLSGTFGLNKDLPPFFMLTGSNIAGSLNLVGMRRSGMPHDQIDDVRWVYKTLYRRGLSLPRAVEQLEERKARPIVAEYLEFLASSKRGLCAARGDPRRGSGTD